MHIVIVTDTGLPDVRIEKEIASLLKYYDKVSFIGAYKGNTRIFSNIDFSKLHLGDPKWCREARLKIEPYYSWVKRKVKRLLEISKPDIVLAIDIYAAIVVHELGYSMVFDDHELYSFKYKVIKYKRNPFKNLINKYKEILAKKIEETVAQEHPVITVSEEIKRYYTQYYGVNNSSIEVIKNFPSEQEALGSRPLFDEKGVSIKKFIYIGKDLTSPAYHLKHRDLSSTRKVLKELYRKYYGRFEVKVLGDNKSSCSFINSVGYVRHMDMYKYINKAHFGIASYNPCIYHRIVSANKIYVYALGGAIPIVTDTFETIVRDFKKKYLYIIDSRNFEESIREVFENLIHIDYNEINAKREKIWLYTLRNLVWEKQEKKLIDTIKKAK